MLQWAALLQPFEWVPTKGKPFRRLEDALVPSLSQHGLSVVNSRAADFGEDALPTTTLQAAQHWGLRADLSWDDVISEAKFISRSNGDLETRAHHAIRLLSYTKDRREHFSRGLTDSEAELEKYKAELSRIEFIQAREPL